MESIIRLVTEGWVSVAIGVVGVLLAIVFYLQSRRRARLGYQYEHVTLVGGPGAVFPEELEIRFAGTIVPRVTASTIVFWNCGDRTINGSDLLHGDPLRVEIPADGQILKYTILRQTRDVNGWTIDQPSSSRLDLSFDFLDPGDGLTIEVIHSQPGKLLKLAGTVKGIPKGILDFGHSLGPTTKGISILIPRAKVVSWFGFLLGILGLVVSVATPGFTWSENAVEPELTRPILDRIAFPMASLLYACFFGFVLWSRRRRYPSGLQPDAA